MKIATSLSLSIHWSIQKYPSTSALLPSAGESAEEVPRYASIEAFVAIGY